jgi:hypothetical protein
MNRISSLAILLVFGLLAGTAASVKADHHDNKKKDKGQKASSRHDDKDHKDHKDHDDRYWRHHHKRDHQHGDDQCNDGSKMPTQYYPGGVKPGPTAPKGTPENPTPVTHKFPRPIPVQLGKDLNKTNLLPVALGKHRPGKPGRPANNTIPTLGTGFNGLAGALGKDIGGAVGFGVTQGLKEVGNIANGVGDVVGGVANAVGDVASGVVNGLESIL